MSVVSGKEVHDGERVLVLQARNARALDHARLKAQLPWAGIDRLVAIERIPTDSRHNAKIDYARLVSLLQRSRILRGCAP